MPCLFKVAGQKGKKVVVYGDLPLIFAADAADVVSVAAHGAELLKQGIAVVMNGNFNDNTVRWCDDEIGETRAVYTEYDRGLREDL